MYRVNPDRQNDQKVLSRLTTVIEQIKNFPNYIDVAIMGILLRFSKYLWAVPVFAGNHKYPNQKVDELRQLLQISSVNYFDTPLRLRKSCHYADDVIHLTQEGTRECACAVKAARKKFFGKCLFSMKTTSLLTKALLILTRRLPIVVTATCKNELILIFVI